MAVSTGWLTVAFQFATFTEARSGQWNGFVCANKDSPLQKVQAIGVRRGTRVTASCPSFSFSWDCPDVFVTLHCSW